jgi:hypothetical protein
MKKHDIKGDIFLTRETYWKSWFILK